MRDESSPARDEQCVRSFRSKSELANSFPLVDYGRQLRRDKNLSSLRAVFRIIKRIQIKENKTMIHCNQLAQLRNSLRTALTAFWIIVISTLVATVAPRNF